MKKNLPVLFIGHGSPMVAVENDAYTDAVAKFGKSLPPPQAIVVVSAHWESARPMGITAGKNPDLIYDFFGFPPELYQLTYPSPGDPVLAEKAAALLNKIGEKTSLNTHRGIDHGVWVPLLHLFPKADIPVVQISLPAPRRPEELLKIGEALAPLRSEGIFFVGSGNLVHNLRLAHFENKLAPVDPWAAEFDVWLRDKIEAQDIDALINYRRRAPQADRGAETTEHFDPLFLVLGVGTPGSLTTVFEGFHYGNISMRTFSLG